MYINKNARINSASTPNAHQHVKLNATEKIKKYEKIRVFSIKIAFFSKKK